MRALIVGAALLAASPAWGQTANNPIYQRPQLGSTFSVTYVTLPAALSTCVLIPNPRADFATPTPIVATPTPLACATASKYNIGSLRSVIIENIGTGDAYCDETELAVVNQGFKLSPGASVVLDKSVMKATVHCISTPGTTLALIMEKD